MQGEDERQRKKVNGNTYDISSIKRVTKKLLGVSRCSRAKQRQSFFVVFHRFPAHVALHAFAAVIFCSNKL